MARSWPSWASISRPSFDGRRHGRMTQWIPMLLPLGGMLTCFFLWINVGSLARIAGTVWALAGILLWLIRRRFTMLPKGSSLATIPGRLPNSSMPER
jgi:hypothetical protein